MEKSSADVLAWILTFGSLDDMNNLRLLNKHINGKFTSMLRILQPEKLFESRLKTYITECGLNVDEFFTQLAKCGGCVAGSIHVQIVLGSDMFKANGLDVLVDFSNLATSDFFVYISRISKGSTIPANQYGNGKCFYKSASGKFCSGVWERKYRTSFLTTTGYQIFVINAAKNFRDFRCRSSTYNGTEYKISGISDILSRDLIPTETFKQTVMFWDSIDVHSHRQTISNFTNQGFKQCMVLEYGKWNKMCLNVNNALSKFQSESNFEDISVDPGEFFSQLVQPMKKRLRTRK